MRWGLIGASTIAAEHMIPAFRAAEAQSVGWIVSSTAERAAEFAAQHGIARSGDRLDDMLADPQITAVYISSTNEKHHDQALAALAAGKHVLCEKPLALSVPQAVAMVRAAADAGLTFATNHHLCNAGSHRAVRDVIRSGRLGRILSLRVNHAVFLPPHLQGWRITSPAAGGGVIADITVHDADTVRFLLNEDPAEVVAQAVSSGMGAGVEDSVMSVWTLPSGIMVSAHESFTHRFAGTGLEVHGTDGSLIARGIMTQKPVGTLELITAEGTSPLPFSPHDLYAKAVGRFIAATQGRGRPAADGADGVKSLVIAEAVREAARSGRRVSIVYPELPRPHAGEDR